MRNLKRALSLLLSSTMVLGMVVMGGSAAGYQDVDDSYNKEAIEVLQAVGIMTGDENGNFNPEKGVTRNEMAVIMSNLMAYNVATYSGTSPFTDVPSWAEPYVAACWTNGITSGISATEYGGDQTVTTAQAALMIMKALGYFQYSSDFGNDWQLSTVSQGNKIDLFNDVNSGVKEAMSRNDVAQLVLNGLESGTVQAETSGSITVGDTTIVSGVKYNLITSGQSYATAINPALETNNDGTVSTGSIVELGEKLYQGDLMKKGGQDDFGRPAAVWSYDNKEIGTYADEADYTYTKAISEKDLYNELGATIVKYDWSVYYNGEDLGSVTPSKNKTDDYSKTATGTLTEVFVDNVDKTVIVTMVDTFLAEVIRVSDDGKTVTVNYLGDQMANTTGRQTSYEVESTDLVEGDKVLVTLFDDGTQFSIASMVKAETVTGEVTAVKARYTDGKGKYAVMDDKQYDYVGNTFAEDLADTDLVDPTLNKENTLYLDAYGNMIAFEATERAVDYLYMKDAIDDLNGIKALAVFADGTSETVHVSKVDGTKNPAVSTELGGNTSGVYSYVKQGDNYELTTLNNANSGADATHENVWTSAPAAAGNYDDGTSYVVSGGSIQDNIGTNDASYGAGHAVAYTIKNGLNAIQANYTATGATKTDAGTRNVVSLSNSTIFVDVEGGVTYTGYTNVPTMTHVSFYVVYNKQLNADVVFITDGADNSTSDSYFMILDATPVASKKAADGTMYYEYKASVNGEETTLTMKGINKDNAGNAFAKHALYKIETITPNGEITEASKVTLFSTTFNPAGSVATEKTSGTIRISSDANIAQCGNNTVVGLGEDIYAYNNDTIFMNVELKADGTVNKVSRSSANAINTTNDSIPGCSNVYVITVNDKDARTPVATLVYVVTPHESNFTEYQVNYPATLPDNITALTVTKTADGTAVTNGGMLVKGTGVTVTATPADGYDAVIKVNGEVDADGVFTVAGKTDITVVAEKKDATVYDGTIDVSVDYDSKSGTDKTSNAWTLTSLTYTGTKAPTVDQYIKAIIAKVEQDKPELTYTGNVDASTTPGTYSIEFKGAYAPYYVNYVPASDNAGGTLDGTQTAVSADALKNALAGGSNVTVNGAATVDKELTVPAGKTLTVEGTLTVDNDMSIASGASLVVDDLDNNSHIWAAGGLEVNGTKIVAESGSDAIFTVSGSAEVQIVGNSYIMRVTGAAEDNDSVSGAVTLNKGEALNGKVLHVKNGVNLTLGSGVTLNLAGLEIRANAKISNVATSGVSCTCGNTDSWESSNEITGYKDHDCTDGAITITANA